ncbi:hypothetical protein [Thermoactinomyces sp. DSM 45892]|uniref:hypothetical protein n=1 Tax=Thermoactinomyces sp. DSM 45892 TaxID=1882753 RepID=UPI00089641F2|nr:hypothetical protein [Thermoactinomyces sp. DSM 45892]SDY38034.1 hypothetical protein SAMN05444416_10496 [Thermoactinomyces sp. DSM 45892]
MYEKLNAKWLWRSYLVVFLFVFLLHAYLHYIEKTNTTPLQLVLAFMGIVLLLNVILKKVREKSASAIFYGALVVLTTLCVYILSET